MYRLKELKDKLVRLIKEADDIIVDRKLRPPQNSYFKDEPLFKEDSNSKLFENTIKYDEEDFLERCEAYDKVVTVAEVDSWIQEFTHQYDELFRV